MGETMNAAREKRLRAIGLHAVRVELQKLRDAEDHDFEQLASDAPDKERRALADSVTAFDRAIDGMDDLFSLYVI
jgi:hypothetical protein